MVPRLVLRIGNMLAGKMGWVLLQIVRAGLGLEVGSDTGRSLLNAF